MAKVFEKAFYDYSKYDGDVVYVSQDRKTIAKRKVRYTKNQFGQTVGYIVLGGRKYQLKGGKLCAVYGRNFD